MAKAKIRLISQLTEEEWQRAKVKRAEDDARWDALLEERRLEDERSIKERKEWRKRYRQLEHAKRLIKEEEQKRKERERPKPPREQRVEPRRIDGPLSAAYKARQEKRAGRPMPDACEICGRIRTLVFDHCHDKGHFRGWICVPCNSALGMARDSVLVLQKMVDYLERDRAGREVD